MKKIITIEDTLELHLDKIFPHRDIVAMKTNNIASYTDIFGGLYASKSEMDFTFGGS